MSIVTEEQLKFENEFKQVLITLAIRFINCPIDQMDQAIPEALRQIVELLGGIRASINRFSEDHQEINWLYQWASPEGTRIVLEHYPTPEAAMMIPVLERGEVIKIGNRYDLPVESEFRGFLADLNIVSVVVAPISQQGNLIGFIAMSWDKPHDIQSETIDLLRLVCEIFLNTMDRRDNENRIRRLNEELEQRVEERTHDLRQMNEQLQNEIAERKQVEAALRTSEERYRIVSQVMSDYAFLYQVEPDQSLKLEWVTIDSYTRLTGYTLDDIQQPYRRYHEADEAAARQDVERTLQGTPVEREYRVMTKTGDVRWIHMRRFPIWDPEQGRVTRFYGVAQDITQRKQAEEELRISEERYRIITELISDQAFLWAVEPDGTFKLEWITPNALTHRAEQQTETIGEPFSSYHPEDKQQAYLDVQQVLRGQPVDREYRIITQSGKVRWVYMRRYPVWDVQHARVVRFYGIEQDITERKLAEAELRASEERYRIITELISDYAFLCNLEPDGNIQLEWITEDSYTRLTGYAKGEWGGAFSIYHPDDVHLAAEDVQLLLHGEPAEREYRIITKRGDIRWINMRRYPVEDRAQGRVTRLYGVAQDITERKQTEEALRRSEEMFRMTFEQAAVGMAHVNPDGRCIRVNQRLCAILGYTTEELLSKNFREFSHPDDLDTDLKYFAQMLSGEIQTYSMHKRYHHKTGKTVWGNLTVSLVHDADGQPDYFIGVVEDITALKLAELARLQSEERYRMVSELISDTAFLYTVEPDRTLTRTWITTESFMRLTGYTIDEIEDTNRLYYPEDAAQIQQDIERTLQGKPTEGEYRIRTKSGEARWVHIHRYPVWNLSHTQVERFYGVLQDITQRKRIEVEEHEQRALAEALLDIADALNSTLDLEEVLDRIFVNIERVVPHTEGSIYLIEEGIARVVRAKGSQTLNTRQMLQFPLATTPNLRRVYETRQPLIILDVKSDPDWVRIPGKEWIGCHVTIPIIHNEQVIGFLTWVSPTPNSFVPKMLQGLHAFAHQTAIAISNARLYEQGKALAILEDRQRLARDLHDAVTQTLFSASMMAEMLLRDADQQPERIKRGLTQLHYLTRGALAEMRSLLMELRPESLEETSLPRLMAQLVEAFTGRTGIVPTLIVDGDRALPQDVKVALYRIAQEALNNISKHARASLVSVNLTMDPVVKLIVKDNGRGFTPKNTGLGSLGMKIMRERAEMIGARLTIESEPGSHTTLTAEWIG